MGRKYVFVKLSYKGRDLENIKAFIDTGSDLTIISSKLAKELKIRKTRIERKWIASDGNEVHSPITEIDIGIMGKKLIKLDEVLIEDAPLDPDSGEEVIIGLDFLQAEKMVLDFND